MPPKRSKSQSRKRARVDTSAVTFIPKNVSFITQLIEVINSGGGIVPFIGSGCSAQSGIIMGQQFDEYLGYVVFLCVAEEDIVRDAVPIYSGRWDLRRNGWPNSPTPVQAEAARSWIKDRFLRICRDSGFAVTLLSDNRVQYLRPTQRRSTAGGLAKALTCPILPRILRAPNCKINQDDLKGLHPFFGQHGVVTGGYSTPGFSPTSYDAIEERAVRSLYDWRATLHFLSELKLVNSNTLLLETPDPAIIDAFNVYITAGRKPNLTQSMLCHLAGPARFRTIITTNFDTLIEDAFQEMKEKLSVISVSIKGSLPDPGIVHARNTVVKLHGTLWETRADFSLDESPSLENKRCFFHYIRGRYPDDLTERPFVPAELLVCGYSGSDKRSVEMLKYVLDASGEDAKIYWVCHNSDDLKKLRALFREQIYRGHIIATVTERCDLLLYELYQRLTLSLPRGGFSYQYSHNVPPNAWLSTHESKESKVEATKLFRSARWFRNPDVKRGGASRPLLLVTGSPGVLATLRHLVGQLTDRYDISQIWLELEDYKNTYSLAYDLFLILSIRLGLFQLNHADLLPTHLIKRCETSRRQAKHGARDEEVTALWREHLSLLRDNYFNIVPGKWVIVLYGRNGPGGCAGWTEGAFWGRNNQDEEYGSTKVVGRFPPFVKALCAVGFHVAYAPYGDDRAEQDAKKTTDLQDVLVHRVGRDFKTLHDSNEYLPPPPHRCEAIERSFSRSAAFRVIPYKFPTVKLRSGSKVINFQRCMDGICTKWLVQDAKGNAKRQSRALLDNLRLLYAATLFRHSRHYSAFLSEGVIHCPYRFNSSGHDNDWIRNKSLQENLDRLRSVGLFYDKRGGFAWTYWDFRLGLRRLIASLPKPYLQKKGRNKRFEPLRGWRSHYHYWISDWYMRAFYTTGHAIPLMEAIFHLYQTVDHITVLREEGTFPPRGRKIELAWRRYRWWRIAVCDMAKALRIGRDAIRLWFGPAKYQEWFPTKPEDALGFQGRNPKAAQFGDELKALLARIREVRDIILAPLGKQKRLQAHGESIIWSLEEELRQLMLLGGERGRIKGLVTPVLGHRPQLNAYLKELSELDETLIDSERPCLWEKAPPSIRTLCNSLCLILQTIPEDIASINGKLADWFKKQFHKDSSDRHFFYLAQQLNEWAFIIVRRAKLQELITYHERQNTKGPPKGPLLCLTTDTQQMWTLVTILTNTAIEVCRALHPRLDTFEQKERVRALCLYGLALGRLGRFYEAHRRLNEANALLSKMAIPASSVLLGILKIRRGEVHLLEAMLLGDLVEVEDWTPLNVEHLCERYEIRDHKTPWSAQERARLYRLRVAKLDDAWCSLESAEHLLAGKLHSSRWWARLCVLKLRCLAEQPEGRIQQRDGDCQTYYRLLAQRQQSEPFDQIWELFSNGVSSSLGHPRLRLRLVDFALRAARKIDLGEPTARAAKLQRLKELADTCLKEELVQPAKLRLEYAQRVDKLLRESVA